MEKNMEKFNEFNKIKDNKFLETEKAEIKEIQVEEKKFFEKIKESAKDIFHFSTKENFKKAVRIVALATVLSVPIGEKVFAEREVNTKESTVVTEQIDKEIDKLEQAQGSKLFERIIEQRQFLKEKYNVEVVGDNSEYTLEELQDFDEALGKVQEFASKQFDELKIVLMNDNNIDASMQAFPNVHRKLDTIKDILLTSKADNESLAKILSLQALLYKFQHNAQDKINIKYNTAYDVILVNLKKNKKIKNKTLKAPYTVCGYSKNICEAMFVHELSHLVTIDNSNLFEEMSGDLSEKFKRINKKIKKSNLIIYPTNSKNDIKRHKGFVSAYAVGKGKFYSNEYCYNENDTIFEDVAETFTYMVEDHHYADDDPAVQEKIKVIKEFLNKRENE